MPSIQNTRATNQREKKILITGTTGYIGGRLAPKLLEEGYSIRVMVRDRSGLEGRSWRDQVEVVEGDVLQRDSLKPALEGIDTAYYLIHSMRGSEDFHARDLEAAGNFGAEAKKAGATQIIYLGGLGDPEDGLSEHLSSRQETGRELARAGVPVTEFRAAIIVGSGSISFEIIRYLTERLPVMICPKWVYVKVQPIAIADVLEYLCLAIETPEAYGKIIEIGGKDLLTYGDMIKMYAKVRGLQRFLFPVPVLTPRLSSHWVHWITPIPADITRPLIDGLKNEVIVRDRSAESIFPGVDTIGYEQAVERALQKLDAGQVETRWTDAMASTPGDTRPVLLTIDEGMIREQRQVLVEASERKVFEVYSRLGGETGWLFWNWTWELRGIVDRLLGGVGLRRGRRDAQAVRIGDAIDFWRVEAVQNERLLRLRAEMKLPGKAWLQFESQKAEQGTGVQLLQTAFFAPKGLLGFLYWYLLYPVHSIIFSGLIRRIKETAELPE